MKKRIARVLLISDFHWLIVPPWKQKGQVVRGISRLIEFFISIWKVWNNRQKRKSQVLQKIKKQGPYDFAIMLGDLAECVFNERGIKTAKDIERLDDFICLLRKSLCQKMFFIPGDHELGYKLPLSCDPEGGISMESIAHFKAVFGKDNLYQLFKIGRFNFIFLSSSLVNQSIDHLPKLDQDEICDLNSEQRVILYDVLAKTKGNETAFLFIHDPDCLEEIDNFIVDLQKDKYVRSDVNIKTFCGHMHAEETLKNYEKLGRIANVSAGYERTLHGFFIRSEKGRKIMEWAKGNLCRLEIFKKYNLRIVPAAGGMMGKGGGFLVLNLYEDGSCKIEKHEV